jgi:hypothetical protein
MNEDTNDDLQPLLGAVGPYLDLTTGPTNPVEEDEEPYPADYYDAGDSDYWEDEEQ